MKRYTETKMEKIVRIGCSRIDQVIDKACSDLDGIKRRDFHAMRKRAERDAINPMSMNWASYADHLTLAKAHQEMASIARNKGLATEAHLGTR